MKFDIPDWRGETAILVGSGPSAKMAPLEKVAGLTRVIAVNNSWRLAPWADMLYAVDVAWWEQNKGCTEFRGQRVCADKDTAAKYGLPMLVVNRGSDRLMVDGSNTMGWGGNSGFQALNIAVRAGCRKIIFVGIDMSVKYGKHWHADHPDGMHNPTAGTSERWRKAFDGAAQTLRGRHIEVVNCSPISALRSYPKMSLEEAVTGVAHKANGATFLAADDMIVKWCLSNGQPFEPQTTEWLFGLNGSGAFVDVGASTGWFAIPMAKRGRRVEAFEPNPAVARRLAENIALNEVSVSVHLAAASAKAGLVPMWINPSVPLTSGGSIERATCARPRKIEVEAVRLDDVVKGDVSILKVDVEGHEMAVLGGAEKLIRRCRPHMVLEANDVAHRNGLARWLSEHGYSWHPADGRNMLCNPLS